MARPLRIEYAGAIYHITSRGIDRREIFEDDEDRRHFIQLLKEGTDFYRVEVMSYCLMNNHFHFLLSTKKANLSRFMQRLNVAYTRYFNYKYKRVGPLMQGRYKAILVGSDEYFLVLSRYIHLNPVKVKSNTKKSRIDQKLLLRRYIWSSYPEVIEPKKRSSYFKSGKILDFVGGDNESGRKKYEEYVMEGIDSKVTNPMEELKYQFLLGSDKFVENIKNTFIKGKDLRPFIPVQREIKQISIREIAVRVALEYGISANDIIQSRSKHKEARKVLIEFAYRFGLENKTLKNLGLELGGISGSGIVRVHERLQKEIKSNEKLNDRMIRLSKSFCQ